MNNTPSIQPLPRRQFLRGAGAVMALPFMESLLPRAMAKAIERQGPPLRMATFSFGQGTVEESFFPTYDGKLGQLPSILRSLEPHKDDMLVLSGLSHHGRNKGLNAHEHCALLHFTGAQEVSREGGQYKTSESFDQVAARHLADTSLFPSIEMGAAGEGALSWTQDGLRVPYEINPKQIFDRMFRGGRAVVAPNWQARANAQAQAVKRTEGRYSREFGVLDLVREDAQRIQRILGRDDRQKFSNYLDSVRSLEQRLEIAEQRVILELLDQKHPAPSRPVLTSSPEFDLNAYRRASQGNPILYAEYVELLSDLMILALQTDSTRVATFSAGGPGSYHGVVTVGTERHGHTLDHNGNGSSAAWREPIAREACRQVSAWMTSLFAKTIDKMKNIDEGGSSLLDNSMVLYTSYMADGGHSTKNYPAILFGKAKGQLKPGRHIAYEQGTPVSNLYCEMLNIMGVETEEFGESLTARHVRYDGRLPGLAG